MKKKIESKNLEKIETPPQEPYLKSLGRIFLREVRLLFRALYDALRDPIIILKRIFWPKSVDKAIKPQASWFEIPPEEPNGKALLLCHGFAATPEIYHELAPKLAAEGYHVRGIRISGHGTTPGHLAQTSGVEWFASVVWHYKELRKDFDNISYIGHSLGATLGLLLCTIYPIDTIVAKAAPIKLHIPPAKFVRQASLLVKYWPRSRRKRQSLEREGISSYKVSPLYAIGGIFEVGNVLRARADKLTLPVLYIRAMDDHKTLLTQPDIVREYFPDANVEFRDAKNSPHSMLQGPERDMISKWIIDWVNDYYGFN